MRCWFLVAILMACKGDKAPPAQTASGSGAAEAPAPAKVGVPDRPSLPPPRPTLPSKTAEASFDGESRDAAWASETEGTIARKFEKVRGAKLEKAECKQTQCKLTIVGSEGDVAQAIADLESARGLHGFAKNVLLTAPEKQSDGTLQLRAFAVFER